MRLIDANALKALIDDGWGEGPFKNAFFEEIDDTPTIDPVKHGMWMHDKDDCLVSGYCSVCGWQSIICETDVADMPFCPNCGAKNGGEG